MLKPAPLECSKLGDGLGSTKIFDYLYLSGEVGSMDRATLKAQGITHIVNATVNVPFFFAGDSSLGLKYHRLSLLDNVNQELGGSIMKCCAVIEEARGAGGAALIHCRCGISRSVALVIGFLMRCRGLRLIDSIVFLRSVRPHVSPNLGFLHQLVALEKSLFKSVSVDVSVYENDRFAPPELLMYRPKSRVLTITYEGANKHEGADSSSRERRRGTGVSSKQQLDWWSQVDECELSNKAQSTPVTPQNKAAVREAAPLHCIVSRVADLQIPLAMNTIHRARRVSL